MENDDNDFINTELCESNGISEDSLFHFFNNLTSDKNDRSDIQIKKYIQEQSSKRNKLCGLDIKNAQTLIQLIFKDNEYLSKEKFKILINNLGEPEEFIPNASKKEHDVSVDESSSRININKAFLEPSKNNYDKTISNDKLFDEADIDGDGYLSREEFMRMIISEEYQTK